MEDNPKKGRQPQTKTKINLIGGDTIVNSPSSELKLHYDDEDDPSFLWYQILTPGLEKFIWQSLVKFNIWFHYLWWWPVACTATDTVFADTRLSSSRNRSMSQGSTGSTSRSSARRTTSTRSRRSPPPIRRWQCSNLLKSTGGTTNMFILN